MSNTTKLDINTFGNSKAAETLVDILNSYDNPHYLRKVSSFLSEHNKMLNQIRLMNDPHIRLSFINMVGDKIRQSTIDNVPERIVTFTKNVAQRNVKRAREANEFVVMADRKALQMANNTKKSAENDD